jgi:SNF2 family DNA or RNA helicase
MEWAPELSVTVVHGPSAMRRIDWTTPAHVYLTTYDTLRSDIHKGNVPKGMRRQFDLVVADEVQYAKNASSKRSQALRRLAPEWRWGLSGTPMENSPEDIVSIFRFLKPGLIAEGDTSDTIRERLASHFLRRRKRDVLPDLPPKIRQEIWLELGPAQRRAYEALESQIRSDFIARQRHGQGISRIHIFTAIQKLKQICNFAPGKTTSPKTDALKDIVEEIAASQSKVIVFSQYVEEGIAKLEALAEPFGVAGVAGGQSKAVRDAEIDRFRSDPETHVLLATIKSGGVGLTLTEASYVVHFDHWWNPALKWQAEDRVHRPGQQAASINIYEFWMNDTIDERISEILERKQALFEAIVDSLSVDELERSISDDEWLSILGVDTGDQSVETRNRSRATDGPMGLEEVLEKLQALDPFDFERLVGELFKHLGYPYTRVTSKSSDGGIDVLAWRNTQDGPERVAIQCKRYKDKVGVKVARELAGVVSSDPAIQKGILVTTGGLTPDCQRFCACTPELEVIQGLQLARHLRNFGILVQ